MADDTRTKAEEAEATVAYSCTTIAQGLSRTLGSREEQIGDNNNDDKNSDGSSAGVLLPADGGGGGESKTQMTDLPEVLKTKITDLPELLLTEVLGRLPTANDVWRSATICSCFASAVDRLLPRGCHRLCRFNLPPVCSSSTPSCSSYVDGGGKICGSCYGRLLHGFLDRERPHVHYGLDESTGALRTSVSVLGMTVIWGETPQYWSKVPIKGSVFEEGMRLLEVCWFEIYGTITCALPPGRYTCAWRLSRCKGFEFEFLRRSDATVTVEQGGASESVVVERRVKTGRRDIKHYPEWTELSVGVIDIVAGEKEKEEDRELVPVAMKVRLFNNNPYWSRGIFVDGFVIRSVTRFAARDQGEQEEGVEEEEEEEEDGVDGGSYTFDATTGEMEESSQGWVGGEWPWSSGAEEVGDEQEVEPEEEEGWRREVRWEFHGAGEEDDEQKQRSEEEGREEGESIEDKEQEPQGEEEKDDQEPQGEEEKDDQEQLVEESDER